MFFNTLRFSISAFLLLSTCAWGQTTAPVTVDTAWVRGIVSGQAATGAFMELKSSVDLTLVGVSSPLAKIVELHAMEMQDGVMKMHEVERLPLPAGKTVRLAPGGYHIMLMNLRQPLRNGDEVPITLTFEDGKKQKQTLEVKAQVRGLVFPAAEPKAGAKTP